MRPPYNYIAYTDTVDIKKKVYTTLFKCIIFAMLKNVITMIQKFSHFNVTCNNSTDEQMC